MRQIPAMVSMERTPKEKEEVVAESMPSVANTPNYPYGLCLSLCEEELAKLDLDHTDFEIGDMLHMHIMATVTSVSSNQNSYGPSCRVELQVTHISAENEAEEDEENDEEEDKPSASKRISKLYV